MHRVDLHSGWKVIDTEPGAGNSADWSKPGLDTGVWHDVAVPGDVNAVLVAAGRMPDPHIGDNARQCYWPTSRDWWYRLEFAAPGSADSAHNDLVLDGIDGHAEIFLNGQKLGRMENAFRPVTFAVGPLLNPAGPNVLLIRFLAIEQIMGGPREHELYGWDKTRCLMRKPQFSFGWDWALPVPSIGIAGPVRLEHYTGPRFVDVSVQPLVSGRLDFKFQVNAAARDAGYHLNVRVTGHGAALQQRVDRPGKVRSYTSLQIKDPQLWWPRGMGDQPLYDWQVDLVVNDQVVETRRGRLGIREVRILEEPFTPQAGPGISFWLQVNGQRVFCKGGNWIPLELFPATATDDQYRFYLAKTADANFNMQRIWGGGIYERDIFYDLCDELGIMVWQDFMFAGAAYPVERLRHEIIAEAEHQVKRLRNRPCIVLWCGCNEDVYSWSLPEEKANAMTDLLDGAAAAPASNRLRDDPQIYSMILRGTVGRLGLGVPYIESSPQSYDDAGNDPQSGNCHISCWKHALFNVGDETERFREHFEAVCSFDSEFCIQGPCDVATFHQFLPPDHCWPPDDIWIYHIQRGHARIPHYEQTLKIAGGIFGPIDSLQKYVKHGQATHVEMMRAEFESARRDRPNNGGTMMWMFNDCWPTANWSIIDYYRRPKPSYYAAKRACATLLPIIFERRGQVEFFFSNDGRMPCEAQLTFGQEHLDGTVVWQRQASVQAGPCDTARFHALPRADMKLAPGDYLFIDALVDGRPLPRVTYFPALWKDVPWPTPHLTLSVLDQKPLSDGFQTQVKIATDTYARFCHLLLPDAAQPFWLDDNFFDLAAHHAHTVHIHSRGPLDPRAIRLGHWQTDWP